MNKFRPYFTLSEMEELISCLKESPSPKRLGIASYLEIFIHKANSGINKPAHRTKPTIDVSLGFTPDPELTIEQLKYLAWIKQTTKPNEQLTAREIELSKQYRYENDLMSPQEEAEYEKIFLRSTDLTEGK